MMKFMKGDIVHTTDKGADGMNIIGIVVDIDYKKHLYAVFVNFNAKTPAKGTFWYNVDEVF